MLIVPEENELTQPYWAAARRGVVALQRCLACDTYWHPPQPTCPSCRSDSWEWTDAGGTGTVVTFTTVHHATHPAVADKVPYILALVRLPEGPLIICNLLGPETDVVITGLPVTLSLGPTPGGEELVQAFATPSTP